MPTDHPFQVHPTRAGGLMRPTGNYARQILDHVALMLTDERTREDMLEYAELIGEQMDRLAKHRRLDPDDLGRMQELHHGLAAAITDDLPYTDVGPVEIDHLAEQLAEVTIEMHRAAHESGASS